jgi:uncharacterized protein
MLKTTNIPVSVQQTASPDYLGLVKFLLQPLLDESESLSLDCEKLNNNQKVWIRLALTGEDTGKVFGRGMRNINAMKTILQTAAIAAGQSVHLDLYGSHQKTSSHGDDGSRHFSHKSSPPRRGSNSKPIGKPRLH